MDLKIYSIDADLVCYHHKLEKMTQVSLYASCGEDKGGADETG